MNIYQIIQIKLDDSLFMHSGSALYISKNNSWRITLYNYGEHTGCHNGAISDQFFNKRIKT